MKRWVLIWLLVAVVIVVLVIATQGKNKNTSPSDNNVVVEDNEANSDTSTATVQQWDQISVWYVWSTKMDGEVFDTNLVERAQEADIYNAQRPYNPLTFNVGQWQMIPWFDNGVVGMAVWETKTIDIPATEWYGPTREDLIQTFPISVFEEAWADWQSWEVGQTYNFDRLQGIIVSKDEESITIDFNHFLAGKDLIFEVTVESIQ